MGHRKGFRGLHKVPTWEDSGPGKEPEGGSSSPVQAWNAVLPQATTRIPSSSLLTTARGLGPMRGLGKGPNKGTMPLEGGAASLT